MSSNKHIKDRMVAKYGPECWIEKLHLRTDTEPRRYTSKAQMKRMKALTYHHIKERRNGGKSTEENGAILSAENHQWFHKQPPEVQARLNQIFQEYKRQFTLLHGDDKKAIEVSKPEEISFDQFITRARKHYNRAAKKREDKRIIDEYYSRED